MKQRFKLMLGDNIESLKKIPDNSIDSVVTDPPYGLSAPKNSGKTSKGGFMNKKWDYDVPSVQFWKEVYRVLKPGGHIVSFGGTRTYHRMVVNIEDAGFEIRDQIMWLYGSGFPKSHNIGKAVDKSQGNERVEWFDENKTQPNIRGGGDQLFISASGVEAKDREPIKYSKGSSPYEGWGTALKPANEPICLARKPLSEKSVAENVLKWKTGGINVDGCRIDLNGDDTSRKISTPKVNIGAFADRPNMKAIGSMDDKWKEGRFPANLILECICDEVIKGEKGEWKKTYRSKSGDIYGGGRGTNIIETGGYTGDKGDIHTNPDCPCRLMDEQSGVSKSTPFIAENTGYGKSNTYINYKENGSLINVNGGYSDKGGASRFFYQAKVSKAERNMGLDHFEIKINIGTIKLLIYKRKNEIIWEKQDLNQTHQVDMEQSQQKDTEEFIIKEECVWNTELFGNYIMEIFQKDIKSITEMKTNSITIYQTLNSLIQQSTNEYIATQQKELMDGIKFVESADKKNTKAIITYQKKDGLNQSVNPASLIEVWSISVEEEVKSNHPTMKPINLMTYLCRLITPENGIVLDPFMGSGSTGIASQLEGFRFVGMEMDEEYMKIATARIENYEKYKKFIK